MQSKKQSRHLKKRTELSPTWKKYSLLLEKTSLAKGRGSRFRSGDEERVNLPSKSVVRKRKQRDKVVDWLLSKFG